jgi:tight adherence protein C
MTSLQLIQLTALCFCGSLFLAAWRLVGAPPIPIDERGFPGLNRDRARREDRWFRTFEPALRRLATIVRILPLRRMRERLRDKLFYGGDPAGLCPEEVLVLIVLGAIAAVGVAWLFELEPSLYFYAPFVGGYYVFSRFDRLVTDRRQQLRRHLPTALELCALCVGAGISFPGALAEIVRTSPRPFEPLPDEFRRLLREIDVGNGHGYALEQLARRVPIEPVQNFVAAVLQSEQRGTPLRDVLDSQAIMQRQQRSQEIEELCEKAEAKLTFPLTMVFVSCMVVIVGPIVLDIHRDMPGLLF